MEKINESERTEIREYLLKIADIVKAKSNLGSEEGRIYVSKTDKSYIGLVGLEEGILGFIFELELTDLQAINGGSVACVGFCRQSMRWYGWSHRAYFGFGVGDVVKKGDCGYKPSTPQELFESITTPDEKGWAWQKPENVILLPDGVKVRLAMIQLSDGSKTSKDIAEACDEIVNTKGKWLHIEGSTEDDFFELKCGRGEWKAETLEDAKQMAMDFAESVS